LRLNLIEIHVSLAKKSIFSIKNKKNVEKSYGLYYLIDFHIKITLKLDVLSLFCVVPVTKVEDFSLFTICR
jgi:hypothetical protein